MLRRGQRTSRLPLQEWIRESDCAEGALRDIPGVGRIASVIVDKSASGKRVAVLFMTSPGGNSGGLVFLHGTRHHRILAIPI